MPDTIVNFESCFKNAIKNYLLERQTHETINNRSKLRVQLSTIRQGTFYKTFKRDGRVEPATFRRYVEEVIDVLIQAGKITTANIETVLKPDKNGKNRTYYYLNLAW